MSPISHLLVGWVVANIPRHAKPRERAMIALAGVAPDVDGLGIIGEVLTRNSSQPLLWWSNYHHILGHNLLYPMILTLPVVLVLGPLG